MIGKIIAFLMKKNVQKIVLGAIVVAAGLIMLKKYMDGKKAAKSAKVEETVEETVEHMTVMPPMIEQPVVEVVDAEVSIEQDPVKDLGQAPMAMPDDSQYGLV